MPIKKVTFLDEEETNQIPINKTNNVNVSENQQEADDDEDDDWNPQVNAPTVFNKFILDARGKRYLLNPWRG